MRLLTKLVRPLMSATAVLSLLAATGCQADDPVEGACDPAVDEDCSATGATCATSAIGAPDIRRLSRAEFQAEIDDVFPQIRGNWSNGFSADPISHWGFDNESARLLVGKQTARELDSTSRSIAGAVVTALADILPCSSAADRACAEEFVRKQGRRLFRRTVTDDEVTRYLGFYDEAASKSDFNGGISWVTRALLMSPEHIYRSELGAIADGARQLDQYEIATALAFTFAGTTPGEPLLDLADAGELQGAEQLMSLASQLIKTPQGRAHMHRFFEYFLEYAKVETSTKENVADFDTLRYEMKAETRAFIEAVIIDGGGGVRELLTATETYPTTGLAAFYGLPAPEGDHTAVARNPGQGVGVLAQGSILATEAGPANSSPTQRGLLIMEKLLCRDTPEVPPDVPEIPPVVEGETTTRQRYEELHMASGGACRSCHLSFDPIGFGFEHFDEAGRFRADENGLAIDASGSIPETEISFGSQEELAEGLATMTEVPTCVSGQLSIYSYGTEAACLGETRRKEFIEGAIGFVDYLASLAAEPHFAQRTEN